MYIYVEECINDKCNLKGPLSSTPGPAGNNTLILIILETPPLCHVTMHKIQYDKVLKKDKIRYFIYSRMI